jgi:hypothetical protein
MERAVSSHGKSGLSRHRTFRPDLRLAHTERIFLFSVLTSICQRSK